MRDQSGWEKQTCPYCGSQETSLAYHLPKCTETPSTDDVIEARRE